MSDAPSIQRRDDLHFQAGLDALLQEAEDLRLTHMRRYRTRGFIATTLSLISVIAGGIGFGWFFLMELMLAKGLAALVLSLILPLWLTRWKKAPLHDYLRHHKTIFMPHLAKLIGGFKFYETRGINAKRLGQTGIVPRYERYVSEDCFIGRYKDTKVIFAEATLYRNEHPHKDEHPVFHGLFVLLEAPQKAFEGHTIVTADKKRAARLSTTRWQKLSPVPLPESESFVAFSTHIEAAQHSLSHALTKELEEAAEVFNDAKITLALFKERYMFMMIPHDVDMFEASNLFFPIPTKVHMQTCKHEIEQLLEVVDIFDLYQKG